MQKLQDKVVVITGAGSGIGRALAIQMAQEGAILALNDVNQKNLTETVDLIKAPRGILSTHLADVSDRQMVRQFAEEVLDCHGRIDVLINNAGVALGRLSTSEMSWENWEWIMGINFWGTVYCTYFFLPHIRQQKEGHIANVSSVFGLGGVKNRSGYCASKFAIRGFTESLQQELMQTQVTASIVLPGGIQTNMVKHSKGWLSPVDKKKAALLQQEDNMTCPEEAARVIIKGIKKKKSRILIGLDAKVMDLGIRLLPSFFGRILDKLITRAEKQQNKKVID